MNTIDINKEMSEMKCFIGTYALDQLPKIRINLRPFGLIINLDPISQSGSHWVSVFVDENNQANYFDSFGFPIIKKEIYIFLKTNKIVNVIYNKYILQSINSKSCGMFCILFLKLRCSGFTLAEFLELYSCDLLNNDLVTNQIIE